MTMGDEEILQGVLNRLDSLATDFLGMAAGYESSEIFMLNSALALKKEVKELKRAKEDLIRGELYG